MKKLVQWTFNKAGYSLVKAPALEAERRQAPSATSLSDIDAQSNEEYRQMSERFFGKGMPRDLRNVKLASIYPENDEFFQRCFDALLQTEAEFVQRLIDDQAAKGVAGSFVEFGIYQGAWIDRLFRMTESAGLTDRVIYGFDSFKGLSKPHEQFDVSFWKEGMYAASRAEVEKNLNIAERPRIKLIEGYFKDSLVRKEAKAVGDVAFARIDCDIYEPAKECLAFLSKRLTHGSILVFDDWTHNYGVGEGRAFAEWISTVPHLKFKFLFLGPWDHLHLRVLHRDKMDVF